MCKHWLPWLDFISFHSNQATAFSLMIQYNMSINFQNNNIYCFVQLIQVDSGWFRFLSSSFINFTHNQQIHMINNLIDSFLSWLAMVNSVLNCDQQVIVSYYSISSAMMQLKWQKKYFFSNVTPENELKKMNLLS